MKKFVFKSITVMLATMLIFSLLPGCMEKQSPNGDSAASATTVTANDEPVVLKMFFRDRWGTSYDNFSINYVQEKTNTKWDMTIVPGGELMSKLNLLLASGERPDIMNIPGDDAFEFKLAQEGILLPINKYFDKLPNLYEKKLLTWSSATHDDGNIYAINACISPGGGVDFVPSYRKDWLEKYGLDIPTTIDEYLIVADAVSNKDPDNNGEKDTYAFGGPGMNDARFYDHIFSAYGALPFTWQEDNGKIINGTVHPNTREALRTLNKLYDMGAIDQEFITDDESRVKEKWIAGVYGAMSYYTHIYDKNNRSNYYLPHHENNPEAVWVEGPILKGPGYRSDIGMRAISQRGWVRTVVSASTKELDAVLRVIDWVNTDEAIKFINYGLDGIHHEQADGIVKYLINDQEQKDAGLTQLYIAMEFLALHNSPEYQKITEYSQSIGTYSAVDGITVPEAALYEADLYDFAKTQYLKIIIGEIPVDQGFDTLLSEWEKRGGNELTNAYDKAYQARK